MLLSSLVLKYGFFVQYFCHFSLESESQYRVKLSIFVPFCSFSACFRRGQSKRKTTKKSQKSKGSHRVASYCPKKNGKKFSDCAKRSDMLAATTCQILVVVGTRVPAFGTGFALTPGFEHDRETAGAGTNRFIKPRRLARRCCQARF